MAGRAPARLVPHFPPLALVLALALALAGAPAGAQTSEPEIPDATGFVNDRAGLMDEGDRARLEAFLDQVRTKTGVQFAVLTVRTTAPLSPSEYKVKVFERWGIGRREQDDGLLMLVAVEEREVRFETGYGLEGTLPDGLQSRIFRDHMAPRFRDGDYSGGITAGVIECARRIGAERGVALEWNGRELRYERERSGRGRERWLLVLLIALVVLVIGLRLITGGGGGFSPPRRRRGFHPGGYWGGGFGGFGGFGGGGSFGGGSFGGFGGGASGGGGGGGKW